MESNLSRKNIQNVRNLYCICAIKMLRTTKIKHLKYFVLLIGIMYAAYSLKNCIKTNSFKYSVWKEMIELLVDFVKPMKYAEMEPFVNYECPDSRTDVQILPPNVMHIAMTISIQEGYSDTERQMRQISVWFKSLLLQQKSTFVVHVFSNSEAGLQRMRNMYKSFPEEYTSKVIFVCHEFCVPDDSIINNFRPGVMVRLLFTHLLPHVDAVIYMDTDVILLKPLEELWEQFTLMDRQVFAMARVSALKTENTMINDVAGFNNRLNSGLLLMNLTKLRSLPEDWENWMIQITNRFMTRLTYPDQDVLTLFDCHFPHYVFKLPCEWNYLKDHCTGKLSCPVLPTQGASLIHGVEMSFMDDSRFHEFSTLFHLMEKFQLGSDVQEEIVKPMLKKFDEKYKESLCTNSSFTSRVLTKGLANLASSL